MKDAQAVAKDFIFGGDAKYMRRLHVRRVLETLVSQMKEASMIKDDIPVKDLYTNEFLPAK